MFICSSCGYGSASWLGRCPNCSEWNTLVKQQEGKTNMQPQQKLTIITSQSITKKQVKRMQTTVHEFDRVIGGGLVPGQVLLLSGEPGVGKSTLLLQSLQHMRVLYICGEESPEQIKERAIRMNASLSDCSFTQTLEVEALAQGLTQLDPKPDIVVVDSVQTMYSSTIDAAAGSVPQLRHITQQLVSIAKQTHIPFMLVGHITKEGDIAGPKLLEHMVDTVLTFEGERLSHFRIIRAQKNRFGPTNEIGIFEMKSSGLHEVNNPLAFLDQTAEVRAPGKALIGVMEGHRPLFFEIQTLAAPTNLAMPRRVVKGLEYNKVLLLLAVARKYLHVSLDHFDIYVNVIGGVAVKSPAADLGCIISLLSSIRNSALPEHTVCVGEVGLLGEVRPIYGQDRIIEEAKRLGYTKLFYNKSVKNVTFLDSIFPTLK